MPNWSRMKRTLLARFCLRSIVERMFQIVAYDCAASAKVAGNFGDLFTLAQLSIGAALFSLWKRTAVMLFRLLSLSNFSSIHGHSDRISTNIYIHVNIWDKTFVQFIKNEFLTHFYSIFKFFMTIYIFWNRLYIRDIMRDIYWKIISSCKIHTKNMWFTNSIIFVTHYSYIIYLLIN